MKRYDGVTGESDEEGCYVFFTDHEEEVKKLKEEIKELHEALQNAANSLDSAGREWDASNAWRYLNKHPELIRQRGAQ